MPRTKLNSRIPISIVFSILFSHTLWSQEYDTIDITEYICHYNYQYQQDSISESNFKLSDMVLLVGESLSQFSHSSIPDKDSLLIAYKNEDPNSAAMKILPRLMGNRPTFFTSYKLIKSTKTKRIDLYEKVTNTYLKVSQTTPIKWRLIPGSETNILGYNCKAASTKYKGREYTAWYSIEIPINDGPYVFNGLPGLILKLHDNDKQHYFELTSFEHINFDKSILLEERNYLETDFKGYQKAKRGDIEERIKRYFNPDILQVSPNELGKIEAKLRSRNNFIERL